MNKNTPIIIAVLCVALLLGGAYVAWVMFASNTSDMNEPAALVPGASNSGGEVPADFQPRSTATQGNPNGSDVVAGPLAVSGYTNPAISVRNFLSDVDVLKFETSGGAVLYSLGTLPQDLSLIGSTTQTLPSAKEKGYEILFSETEGTFLVHLVSEPLGTLRRQVANDLQARLGVDQFTLCTVQIAVVVTAPHPTLRGKYIGLPDCTGALLLPE